MDIIERIEFWWECTVHIAMCKWDHSAEASLYFCQRHNTHAISPQMEFIYIYLKFVFDTHARHNNIDDSSIHWIWKEYLKSFSFQYQEITFSYFHFKMKNIETILNIVLFCFPFLFFFSNKKCIFGFNIIAKMHSVLL